MLSELMIIGGNVETREWSTHRIGPAFAQIEPLPFLLFLDLLCALE
jgi:hypothetical protein